MALLDKNITQGIRIATAPDGRVFLAERDGRLKVFKPDTGTTVVAGQIPTGTNGELGFVGLAVAPDIATTSHIYAHYVPLSPGYTTSRISRVSRFTLSGDTLDLASERPIYNVQHPAYAGGGHSAGDLQFASNGDLFIATGDNTGCCASAGYPPMDERPGQTGNDAQATSANTNNPNGKILRIHPLPDPGGAVGEGSTYSIPAGNLFTGAEDGGGKTLREIYAMGLRNPFTIGAAESNGEVWFADYGPDATLEHPTRGPAGHVSMILQKQPANYGWPYCYVPGKLALTLGTPASFGAFTPGVARDYTASTAANVVSTAGDAVLTVADPSSASTGRLANGAFALPQALQAGVGTAFAPVGGSAAPTLLKTWATPTSNESVTVYFKQSIAANDALRTGAYSKTLTFTLSTTQP